MRKLIALALLATIVGCAHTAASGPPINLSAPAEVAQGAIFSVSVDIGTVTALDAGQFDITFDESMLRFDGVSSGAIGGTDIPVDLWNRIGAGRYRFIVNVPGVPGVSGAGSLAVLHFNALGVGTAAIEISNGFINDNLAVQIDAVWTGTSASIRLVGDADGNGSINTADVTKIERIICLLDAPTVGADANRDSQINTADVTSVERIIVEV